MIMEKFTVPIVPAWQVSGSLLIVLFYLETSTKINSTDCIEQKCQWVIPNYQKDIPYLPVKDMDFSSSTEKKGKIDTSVTQQLSTSSDTASDSSAETSNH